MAKVARKIVQIAGRGEGERYYPAIYALADDGSLWCQSASGTPWQMLEPLPDREEPNDDLPF